MFVLGVMGSPRLGSNSDILLDNALKGAAAEGAKTEKIVLNELLIHGCNDCKACNETGLCVIEDDMQKVLPPIREADYIIHATPIYFWSMTAQTKAYLDRWCSLYDASWSWQPTYSKQMRGKKIGLITVCGDTNTSICDPVEAAFKNLCKFCAMKFVGSIKVSANAKGEVAGNKTALDEAFRLGKAGTIS